jgi:hypothetical protein
VRTSAPATAVAPTRLTCGFPTSPLTLNGIPMIGSPIRLPSSGTLRAIALTIGKQALNFDGLTYLLNFTLPNFYFHLTTAYDILRHNGVELGKRDFMGVS